jgi:hypothetical protein
MVKKQMQEGAAEPLKFEVGDNLNLRLKTNGLIGRWPLNSGNIAEYIIKDISGNGNLGELTTSKKSPNYNTNEQISLNFDGESTSISVNDSPNLNPVDQMTISAWIKLNSGFQGNPRWISKSNSSVTNGGFMSGYWGGKIHVVFGVGSSSIDLSSNIFALNKTNHVAATFYSGSDGTAKLYINGILVDTKSTNTKLTKNISPLFIGSLYKSDWWYGTISDVRFYSRALSGEEISKLYRLTN